jgi:hypothetical protein
VQARGRIAEGQVIDQLVDAILADDELELRAMDTGRTLGRFAFSDPALRVAGTAKQFILCCDTAGPIVVSGGVNRFRENLVQNDAVRAAARNTLAKGPWPVFRDGNPVVCHVDEQAITIAGAEGRQQLEIPDIADLQRESSGDRELLATGPAVRVAGEREVLQALFGAIATQCCRRQFVQRPRELLGAIVALERDYFIYSLFGPLYEVHAILDPHEGQLFNPQPIGLPRETEARLALANVMAKSLEPLRNHLDKLCYLLPSLLVKGDAGIGGSQQPMPRWLKDQERSYRGVLLGVQPVIAEIRMIRELLLRVRGVEERLGRSADYGGATLSAALGAVVNPLFLLSAAQQVFAASRQSDSQKESQAESAEQAIERAVHQWNYLVLELLPSLWHHLLEGLFPVRLQFYDRVRRELEDSAEDQSGLLGRLSARLAVLATYLHFPEGPASKATRAEMAAGARRLQEQLTYTGLQAF